MYNKVNEMLNKWRQIRTLSDNVVCDLSCAIDVMSCPYHESDDETIKLLIDDAEETIKTIKKMLDKACKDWNEWEKYADFMNWNEVRRKEARIRELEKMLAESDAK